MSQHEDEWIRELFDEASRAAPEPPPMPALDAPPLPWRRVVLAPSLAVLLVFVGVLVVLRVAGIEIGFSAASDAGDSAEPGESNPKVAVLVDLDLACGDFKEAFGNVSGTAPDDRGAEVALEHMAVALAPLKQAVEGASARLPHDTDLSRIAMSTDQLLDDIVSARDAGTSGVADRYQGLRVRLGKLGKDLAEYRAIDCVDLSGAD